MKFMQIFVIFLFVKNSIQFNIECVFLNDHWNDVVGELYTCEVDNISNLEESALESVKGSHLSGKTKQQVKGTIILTPQSENLKHFPRNLLDFFPNLIAIYIGESDISKITSADLKTYTKLKTITIYKSKISSISSDLFEFNTELKLVSFSHNNFLKNIDEYVLNNLKQLKQAHFLSNKCVYFKADNPKEINELKKKFKEKCTPEIDHDQCPSSCTNTDDFKNLLDLVESLKRSDNDQQITIKELKRKYNEQQKTIELLQQKLLDMTNDMK